MANPTINADSTLVAPGFWRWGGSTAKMRVFALSAFRSADGVWFPQGNVNDPNSCCLELDLVVNVNLSVSSPSTNLLPYTETSSEPNAKVAAYLYDSRDIRRHAFLERFSVTDEEGSVLTWEMIAAYNAGVPRRLNTGFPNTVTVAAMIHAARYVFTAATTLLLGGVEMATPPADAAHPKAVGDNDPRLPAAVIEVQRHASLAGAVLVAGTAPTTLVIGQALSVSSPLTIPPNVTLRFTGTGHITNSSTLTINGVVDAHPTAWIFKGAGTVLFGGASKTKTISPVWFGAAGVGTTTTGAISSGQFALTLADPTGYAEEQRIVVAGAGVAGAQLFAKINSLAGSVATLDTAASTSVLTGEVSHNDTYAFRAAFAAHGVASARVFGPCGHYMISGPLATANAAVSYPANLQSGGLSAYRRDFVGELAGTTSENGSAVAQAGVLIDVSRLAGSGTYPSAFAAASYNPSSALDTFNWMTARFENVFFRTRPNPDTTILQFHEAANFQLKNCQFDVGTYHAAEPTNQYGVAVVTPKLNNQIQNYIEDVSVLSGFWIGMVCGEAVSGNNISIGRCKRAMYWENGFGGSTIGRLAINHCPVWLDFAGVSGQNYVLIRELYGERYLNGTSGSAEWWGITDPVTEFEIYSPNNLAHLRILAHKTQVAATGTVFVPSYNSAVFTNVEMWGMTQKVQDSIRSPLQLVASGGSQLIAFADALSPSATVKNTIQQINNAGAFDFSLGANAEWDGSNWVRATGSKFAQQVEMSPTGGATSFRVAASGSGNITWNEVLRLTTAGVRIGSAGTHLSRVVKGTVAINPASIAAGTVVTQTFTLAGAAVGDSLILNIPAAGLTAGLLVLQARVSAADTISVVFYNSVGAPVDEASADWTYMLVR